jgi:hypothetical protein
MSRTVLITNAAVSTAQPQWQWKTFYFNLRDFRNLPTTRNHYVKTPEFSCNGHQWCLKVFSGGTDDATEGWVSIYLNHRSERSVTVNYELMILDKFGNKKRTLQSGHRHSEGALDGYGYGWSNFMRRSAVLDKSQNILDSEGTLTVGVSIKEKPTDVFVPKNPLHKMMQGIFLDEATADVCFSLQCRRKEGKEEEGKGIGLISCP